MNHLLLLHGALGHPQQFAPYETELEARFQLHKIMFRGHGNTGVPENGLPIEAFVSQVADYIRMKQLDKVNIFGYSMGGYVGLLYAARFPERVVSVLTLATKFHWTEASALRDAQSLDPHGIREKVPQFAKQLAGWHGAEHWEKLLSATREMMIRLGKNPLLSADVLSRMQMPVQLMSGDKDRMVSMEETAAAAAMLPLGTAVMLPETKHPFEQVNVPALIKELNAFWKTGTAL
jgi:pimeloyl-ACP methyl ester carboxylesterase